MSILFAYFHTENELRLRRSQGKVKRGLICIYILKKTRMRKLSPDFRKKTNESLCFAKHKQNDNNCHLSKSFKTSRRAKYGPTMVLSEF